MTKILFIANPISGGKSKDRIFAQIAKYLDKEKFEYEIVLTEYAGHATSLATESSADIVCAVGGDGTVNEVARGLIGSEKILAIIPCGSGDGLALDLGISRIPRKAIETINRMAISKMDYGKVNGREFFCTTGVGLDAMVSDKFASASTRGLATYIGKLLETLVNFKPETYTITVDGETVTRDATLITVGNANQWGNRGYITPHASIRDGRFDVTVIDKIKPWDLPGLVIRLLNGTIDKNPKAHCIRGSHVQIHRESEGPAHFDGDPAEMGQDIDINIVPGALKVIYEDIL